MLIFRPLKIEDETSLLEVFKDLTDKKVNFNASECVSDPNANCLVAEEEGVVVGFGSIIIHRVPTKGLIGTIEDIVVCGSGQGKGLGRQLMKRLIEIARTKELKSVNLTCGPQRVAAGKLYESIGFVQKDTRVYELSLS